MDKIIITKSSPILITTIVLVTKSHDQTDRRTDRISSHLAALEPHIIPNANILFPVVDVPILLPPTVTSI